MALVLSIILMLLLEIQGTSCLWTVSKVTAKAGGFITIPCHYHRLHRENLKYWCKGKNWSYCMIVRASDQKQKRPGINFHNNPEELVTTMTMTNLHSSDSNRYWCAVKMRGLLSDIRTSLELAVTDGIPDLSVVSNIVSSEEGGNITVECIYSEKLKDAEKKWCKSGDLRSCQTAQDIEPSPDTALQINDTNDGVFRVILTGLKKTDAGWYWCMAGGIQAPVYINITLVQPTSTNTTGPSISTMAPWSSHSPTSSFAVHPLTNSTPTFYDVNSHISKATLSPTTSILPERTSKTSVPTSSASPKRFPTTIHSQTYPTTNNSSLCNIPTVTLLTRSATTHVSSSNSAVSTVSSEDLKSTFENRDLIWVIVLVCGAFILLFILPGLSWTLWSWHSKSNTGEETTEITTEFCANDRDDLLNNEWTATSVAWINTGSDTVIIT